MAQSVPLNDGVRSVGVAYDTDENDQPLTYPEWRVRLHNGFAGTLPFAELPTEWQNQITTLNGRDKREPLPTTTTKPPVVSTTTPPPAVPPVNPPAKQ